MSKSFLLDNASTTLIDPGCKQHPPVSISFYKAIPRSIYIGNEEIFLRRYRWEMDARIFTLSFAHVAIDHDAHGIRSNGRRCREFCYLTPPDVVSENIAEIICEWLKLWTSIWHMAVLMFVWWMLWWTCWWLVHLPAVGITVRGGWGETYHHCGVDEAWVMPAEIVGRVQCWSCDKNIKENRINSSNGFLSPCGCFLFGFTKLEPETRRFELKLSS